jgi:alpha-galactosidase
MMQATCVRKRAPPPPLLARSPRSSPETTPGTFQRHIHLDDCWAGTVNKTGHNGGRNVTGYLEADRKLFPGGMKATVDYVHSKNLTFGLYTCAGNFTCIGGRPGSGGPYDPRTGITAHVNYEKDARTFAEWGVDFVRD